MQKIIIINSENIDEEIKNKSIKKISLNIFATKLKIYLEKNNDDDTYELNISSKYYNENRKYLDTIIKSIIKNTNQKKFTLAGNDIITEEAIKYLAENENIEEVELVDLFYQYALTKNDYDLLKGKVNNIITHKVSDELEDNFDSIISYNQNKPLVYFYTYKELSENKSIQLPIRVDDNKLKNLKYINKNALVLVTINSNWIEIIKELQKEHNYKKILITGVKDLLKFAETAKQAGIDTENVMVFSVKRKGDQTEEEQIKLADLYQTNSLLEMFVEPAKDLSPFEKYIYAYNISKRFKEYKEVNRNKDKMNSRRVDKILFNSSMVCVGYSNFFIELLHKLGIESQEESLNVEISSYIAELEMKKKYKDTWNSMSKEEKEKLIKETKQYVPATIGGHARTVTRIKDDKYDIDGIYFADPTWDNDLLKDYYVYLAMTREEVINSNTRFMIKEDTCELLYSKDEQELYDKINYFLKRNGIDNEKKTFEYIITNLISIIKKLDSKYYNELKEKYNFIENKIEIDSVYNLPSRLTDLLHEIANYIVEYTNRPIDGDKIQQAIKKVYESIYEDIKEDELNIELAKIFEENQKKEQKTMNTEKFVFRH